MSLSRIDAEIDALLLVADGADNTKERRARVKDFLFQTFLDAEKWREKCREDAKEDRLKRLGWTG